MKMNQESKILMIVK